MSAPRVALPVLLLACCPLLAWASATLQVDAARSQAQFTLGTRWGQVLAGRFPPPGGEWRRLPDGRQQVRVELDAGGVAIAGNARYTRITRGPDFFDAGRHPRIEFSSLPYPDALLQRGGVLSGTLSIRGVARAERFELAPGACARPGLDCDVVARGRVSRARYGMTKWRLALADPVQFELRLRMRDAGPAR